jgi:hypothetical protein
MESRISIMSLKASASLLYPEAVESNPYSYTV